MSLPSKIIKEDADIKLQKMELTPEPVCCSEKGCSKEPVIAYWQIGEYQFKFACSIHQNVYSTNGKKIIEIDSIENYRKKAKRKIYHKHFQEFLK